MKLGTHTALGDSTSECFSGNPVQAAVKVPSPLRSAGAVQNTPLPFGLRWQTKCDTALGCQVASRFRRQAAFTMVEIALCLGIIAFALVAIIGVLPTGLKVQKENREETVINQDGLFLLEAVRSGSKGVDDLTNYVDSITVKYGTLAPVTYVTSSSPVPNRLTNGQHIVGLLSTPKLEVMANGSLRENSVTAHIRAINGVAGEKSKLNQEMAFRYLLISEIVPFTNRPPVWSSGNFVDRVHTTNLLHNLYDVRFTIRWPLFQRGDTWRTGSGRKTFRTLVSGEIERVPFPGRSAHALYFFQPNFFTPTNTLTSAF